MTRRICLLNKKSRFCSSSSNKCSYKCSNNNKQFSSKTYYHSSRSCTNKNNWKLLSKRNHRHQFTSITQMSGPKHCRAKRKRRALLQIRRKTGLSSLAKVSMRFASWKQWKQILYHQLIQNNNKLKKKSSQTTKLSKKISLQRWRCAEINFLKTQLMNGLKFYTCKAEQPSPVMTPPTTTKVQWKKLDKNCKKIQTTAKLYWIESTRSSALWRKAYTCCKNTLAQIPKSTKT